MAVTLVENTITGDRWGRVTVMFTTDTLLNLIAMWNMNSVRDARGNRITLEAQEYEPGIATLLSTVHQKNG